jgi:hypothetical protein
MRKRPNTFDDFHCGHCNAPVSSARFFSGVNNRNHCPYCLWSRHLDMFNAGDRLSACKALMGPIALTTKRSHNKYGDRCSELMLVHLCTGCQNISINRIAADDDTDMIMDVFNSSFSLPAGTRNLLVKEGIRVLSSESLPLLGHQLFGKTVSIHRLKTLREGIPSWFQGGLPSLFVAIYLLSTLYQPEQNVIGLYDGAFLTEARRRGIGVSLTWFPSWEYG